MPEGPSIVLLVQQVKEFTGRKILEVSGSASAAFQHLKSKKVKAFSSWGKHFLVSFSDSTLRIHFMLFGSYSLGDAGTRSPKLTLRFRNGTLHMFACSIKQLDGAAEDIYDWSVDVMSDVWDAAAARKTLSSMHDVMVCDALLDQRIFSGVGNIIKNEVLFKVRVQPESSIASIPAKVRTQLVAEVRRYSFQFLEWKKANVLKKHWQVHRKKVCPRCDIPLHKKLCGTTRRRSFYCGQCQVMY